MNACPRQRWGSALVLLLAGANVWGCSGRKQVPFGLKDADAPAEAEAETEEAATEFPASTAFGPNQVEVRVAESTLVLQAGYALAALELDLDGNEPTDALVVSADPQAARLQAAFPRGLDVTTHTVDSFLVPSDCIEPSAEIQQLSTSLVGARVTHSCETGPRTNVWLATIEAQPRVRERITVLPPNERSKAPIDLELLVEDQDADGYDDVIANVRIGETLVPLAWLNRPGGFARDASQPEATLQELADSAWTSLDSDLRGAQQRAHAVLDAFVALCRESGAARIGLSGTHGIQCQRSPATGRAVSVAITAAVRRGNFVRALELQRWWEGTAIQPTAEERALAQSAWRKAKATANWRTVSREATPASLYFRDADTLVVDGRAPRAIQLSSGAESRLSEAEILPPVRDPDGRFAVRGVRVTCVGFEAEVGPIRGKQTHRVPIDRPTSNAPCKTAVDRPASVFDWAVLGWAPQGLVVASGDLLKVVPVNAFGKPAGNPIELRTGSPLPAPIRGARITPDGSRYVIPHPEGVLLREWRGGGTGLWLRPPDWNAVPGELRSIAISPDGKRVAVQKGTEIRLLSW